MESGDFSSDTEQDRTEWQSCYLSSDNGQLSNYYRKLLF